MLILTTGTIVLITSIITTNSTGVLVGCVLMLLGAFLNDKREGVL